MLKEVLKYQELDQEIIRLENELNQNDDRKKGIKAQQYLKDCQAKLIELNGKAKVLESEFEQYKSIFNQMIEKLDLVNKNSGVEDEKKLDGLIEASDAITNNLVKLERKMNDIIKSSQKIEEDYTTIMKNARNAKMNLQQHKENFGKTKDEATTVIEQKKAELEKIGKTVDGTLLNKYKQKRNEKANVFVPEINGKCGGCRMDISVAKLSTLKAKGMIECENCGRIIYTKA